MKIRLTGLAVLLFTISVHAEISAPPALNPGKNAKKAEDIPVEPSPVAAPSVRPQIQTPIAFENLAVDIEEDPELAPSLASSAASVKSLQEELEHSMLSGDLALSEKIFNKLIRLGAPAEQKRNAMLAMGRYLEEKQNAPTKAAVIYEQFVNLFPNDPEDPDLLLRLGKIYRDNGAFASSLNKFYSVLYSSLQLKNGDAYIDSSLRAKMEIAHTHFAMGDYKTAAQLYSRLKLIDMPQTEASEVTFRAAYIAFLSGDFNTSLNESQRFLSTYPGSPIAPEAQYLIVQSLKSLGRRDDAMRETVKLLQAGREFGRKKPAIWAYWQRKTGNEIANELYESGDAVGALSIYQRLAELDDNPNWRGSTVYQIGLCFERLRHLDRAREAYRYIIDKIPLSAGANDTDAIIGINLATLREMAQWRLDNLAWMEKTEKDVYPLLDKPVPPTNSDTKAAAQATPTPLQTAKAAKRPATTAQTVQKTQAPPPSSSATLQQGDR